MDFLWLEDLNSPESLAWVAKENALTVDEFKKHPGFQQHFDDGLEIFSSKNTLGCRLIEDDFVHKVEKSETSPIGKWMWISYADYKAGKDSWKTLIDFDRYSREHGQQWTFQDVLFSPSRKRALVRIALEDGDRAWIREFDMATKQFVVGGFEVPVSKTHVTWFTDDAIFIGGDTPETQNKHGYCRTVDLWKRGEKRRTIFEGSFEDQFVYAQDASEGGHILAHYRNWEDGSHYWLNSDLQLSLLNLPTKLSGLFKIGDEIVFKILRDSGDYKAGTLLKASMAELIANRNPRYEVVWVPTATKFSTEFFGKWKDGFFQIYRENVSNKMSYFKKEGAGFVEIPQKIPAGLQINHLFMDKSNSQVVALGHSFTSPPALYEWDGVDSYTKIRAVPDQFSGDYEVSQKWTASADGTKVPYFLIHKKGLVADGKHPTLLYGYGGFMNGITPEYRATTGKAWLEKGGVFAVANIRGGDEFGPEWSMSARKENKQRSYDDFIAVAEHLISSGITSPRHLGIMGRSNGGLLVGAVTMQRPELFSAVVCGVPLLDMLRYTELPPGATWADEYGNPNDPAMRAVIEKYSPFQNVRADKKYPPIYFVTSKADDRVHPSHARRMAAKMKAMGHHCYLYEEPTGGHGGGDVKVKALGEALTYSYLWKHLG